MDVVRGKAMRSDVAGAVRGVVGVVAAWRLGQSTAGSVSGSVDNDAQQRRARRCAA